MGMARVCDVFGRSRGVRTYQVIVKGAGEDASAGEVENKTVDLCPAGLERLLGKVKTGTTPARRNAPTK